MVPRDLSGCGEKILRFFKDLEKCGWAVDGPSMGRWALGGQ